jgi:hypothetical protein
MLVVLGRGREAAAKPDPSKWIHQGDLPGLIGQIYGVALDGDTAVIDDVPIKAGTETQGGCKVLTRSGATWTLEATLTKAVNPPLVSGNTAICGSTVFVRSGTSWTEQAILPIVPIALDGDRVVGYPVANSTMQNGVYVFLRSGTTWAQEAMLPNIGGAGTLALSGDTMVVGEGGYGPQNASSGNVAVFSRSGSSWTQTATFQASDATTSPADGFGAVVALSGQTAFVGNAPAVPPFTTSTPYIFSGDASGWKQVAEFGAESKEICPNTDGAPAWYVSGSIAAWGGCEAGVDVFALNQGSWTKVTTIANPHADGSDPAHTAFVDFGAPIALSGGTILVGAAGTSTFLYSPGGVAVFVQDGSPGAPCGQGSDCQSGTCTAGVCAAASSSSSSSGGSSGSADGSSGASGGCRCRTAGGGLVGNGVWASALGVALTAAWRRRRAAKRSAVAPTS